MRPRMLASDSASLRLITGPAAATSLSALAGLAVGAMLVAKPTLVVLLIAAGLALGGIAAALTYPAATFAGLVLLTALIPSYAAPSVGPLLFIPAAGASWAIAVALGWRNLVERGRVFRPTAIDLWVGVFALLMLISISFSARVSLQEYSHQMFLWLGPFLGARMLLAEVERPARLIALAFAVATVISAPFALVEYLGATSPFHSLNFNAAEYATWAGQAARLGQIRAEAAFGHPIALSMFVASSAALSLAMALNSGAKRERNLWYGAAGVAVAVQILTVSRTGWIILAISGVGLALVSLGGSRRGRIVTLAVCAGLALLVVAIAAPSALEILPGFEKSESGVENSTRYRNALLQRALEPGVLHAWGNPRNNVTPFVNYGEATDNAYIILADAWGLIPTAALFLLAVALALSALRWQGRDTEMLVALPIVAFANFVAIFFVAFITQQQVVIWLLVGASAAGAERLSRAPRPAQPAVARERM